MTMKYLVLVGDGMADWPSRDEEAGSGKTPLQVARTPHMDRIAQRGVTGSVMTIPEGYDPGSDVANLSLLGYDPRAYYTGRAPLEAASLGVALGPEDMAFRCNLVTLGTTERSLAMEDFSAGHISTDQARQLVQSLDRELADEAVRFYPGTSYRHLMVWKDGRARCLDLKLTPPHDISGQEIGPYLPQGGEAKALLQWMTGAQMVLKAHPLNRQR
ncbi:MAG: phosphoglycerate mutase, partial [Candidatus Tectomicrobia bacterium]|nr:phosphoglycerate mutase [Candidatus Tectomicrobia bacterium]